MRLTINQLNLLLQDQSLKISYKYCYSLPRSTISRVFLKDDKLYYQDSTALKEYDGQKLSFHYHSELAQENLNDIITFDSLTPPVPGEVYKHYKGAEYEIAFISKSGNKESDMIYVTYRDAQGNLYTRTLDDFLMPVFDLNNVETFRFVKKEELN